MLAILIEIGICSIWIIIFTQTFFSYRSHLANKKKNSKVQLKISKNIPTISVIIPARNEEQNIERCLLSLLSQNYPYYEVILIDDNSDDKTVQKARIMQRKFIAKFRELKIIELKSKPEDWTGKTWASEKGLLSSRNNLLLFLDADCYYKEDCISFAVSHMINHELDVLTGYPLFELKDFWSKITMPLWKLMSFTFQDDAEQVNDPNSKVAYLMGCFFMVKKQVLLEIGSFACVKNALQEDKELGQRLKNSGFKVNMVQMESSILALWSRNLSTLWHGLARTISPMMLIQERKILVNFFSIFVLSVVPPILAVLSFALSIQAQIPIDTALSSYLHWISFAMYLLIYVLATCCVIMKLVNMCKIFPGYALLFPVGGFFLTLVYLATMLPLILSIKNSSKNIEWKGRIYTYNRIGGKMI